MKKAKNYSQKTNRYNGYNAFGLRCEVKTVKLNRENALEQCLKIMDKVEIAQAEGRRLEFTLDWSALPKEEAIQVSVMPIARSPLLTLPIEVRPLFQRDIKIRGVTTAGNASRL